ncbi:condensation domain-containing protein [Actinomycetes bacterium KLBMP 9797]
MGTFLVTTYGSNGDVLPFIRLGQALRGRGHEVVLHTHAYYAATARAAGLPFVPVDTEEAYERTLADAQDLLLNVLADVNHLVDFYDRNGLWEQIRLEYESMAGIVRSRGAGAGVVAVSRHTSGLSALMLREAFGVPAAWVGLSPTLFMAEPLTERLFPTSLAAPMNRVRTAVGLPALADWAPWLSSADLRIGLWPRWFDEVGERAPAGAALPGFVLHDDAETGDLPPEVAALVADDVPPARRPVLVTGGSGQLLHQRWYQVAAEACARVGRPAILVCRHRRLLPERLPDGVHWQPVLPFRTLMPRVAAVVHHGGVLTGARAVASGVPQVVLAHGTDRPDNAARLRRLGLAEWLPAARWTTDATAALLARVLADPSYATRARAYAGTVDSPAAVEAAVDALEALLRDGSADLAKVRRHTGHSGMTSARSPGGSGLGRGSVEKSVRERVSGLSPAQRAVLAQRLANRRPTVEPLNPRVSRRDGDEVFDCSPHQRRAWLATQIDPAGTGTHVATAIHLRGPLDVAALAGAVDDVVARHDALRTVAVPGDDGPRQRVLGALRAPLRVDELGRDPSSAKSDNKGPFLASAQEWVAQRRGERFDLGRGPLVRTALLRVGTEEHVFVLAGHHFVLDAASLGIVVGEIAARYAARISGPLAPYEPAPAVQYPDVATRQRQRLADGGLRRGLDFWRRALAGLTPPPELPLPPPAAGADGPMIKASLKSLEQHEGRLDHGEGRRLDHGEGNGEAVRVLGAELVDKLTAAAGGTGRLLLGPVLLTAYQLVLARRTGRTEVAVALFVGGRTEPGTDGVVGDFTNAVVVRDDWSDAPTFPAAVRRVGETFAAALAHQDTPYEDVIAAVAPPRAPGRPPLAAFGFNLQDYRLYDIAWPGLTARVLPVPAEHRDLDLTLVAIPLGTGEVKVVLEYDRQRFAAAAVEELADQFVDALRVLSVGGDRPVWTAIAAAVPEGREEKVAADEPVPFTPPRTDGEELVAGVFAEVLATDRVGVHDDFFALGGHSLHAVRLIGRINGATGLDAPISAVFAYPTVAALTEALEELAEER